MFQVQKASLAKGEDPLEFCTNAAEKFKVSTLRAALTLGSRAEDKHG